MIHIKYNDFTHETNKKGDITWISPEMKFEYSRGNVSRELWIAIDKFLNTKKGKKQ